MKRSLAEAGTVDTGFVISNSGMSCDLKGHPVLSLVSTNGNLAVRTGYVLRLPGFNGAPMSVRLPAHDPEAAGFVVEHLDQATSGGSCKPVTFIRILLPASARRYRVSGRGFVACGPPISVRISPVVSSARYRATFGT